jgi:hypothetical protein
MTPRKTTLMAAALAAAATALFSPPARTAGLADMSFEEHVAEADVVVLAKRPKGVRGKPREDASGQLVLTSMDVLRVLKGDKNLRNFDLVTKSDMVELNPGCCAAGRSYLLLLKRGYGRMYEVVNGRYSVIVVP